VNTRLWYFFQAAAQDSPATYGIAPELYAPGGWELWWRSGIRGSPPGEVLSECQVPLIIQNWTGQDTDAPTQDRTCDLPSHYLLGAFSVLSRYRGILALHGGSPHNSEWASEASVETMERAGLWAFVACRKWMKATYRIFDAFGEAVFEKLADNIHGAGVFRRAGFSIGVEGGLPSNLAAIFKPSIHLWQRSALLNMVNNPKAREDIAPLDPNVENVVWLDNPSSHDLLTQLSEAEGMQAEGVPAQNVTVPAVLLPGTNYEFVQSAARPLSAAISVGMKAEQVREIWGGGK